LTRLITAGTMSRQVHRPVTSIQVDVPRAAGKRSRLGKGETGYEEQPPVGDRCRDGTV
jgi:hypothetical protein